MAKKIKLLQNSDCPNFFKISDNQTQPHPHLWQDAGRVGGSVCIKGTRMPISSVFGWLTQDLLELIPQEKWDEYMAGLSYDGYTREQVDDALSYASCFFHQTRLDLTNPLVTMALELLTRNLFLHKEQRVNEDILLTHFEQPDFDSDKAREQINELTMHLMEFLKKLKVSYDQIQKTNWEEINPSHSETDQPSQNA